MEFPEIDATRVQSACFIPADVAENFGVEFLDEAYCRQFVLRMIHGDGDPKCPKCHAILRKASTRSFWEGKRIRCSLCGKFFTATTGTFLSGNHLSYRAVVLIAVLLYLDIAHKKIARILQVSTETVRLWEIKFKMIGRLKN